MPRTPPPSPPPIRSGLTLPGSTLPNSCFVARNESVGVQLLEACSSSWENPPGSWETSLGVSLASSFSGDAACCPPGCKVPGLPLFFSKQCGGLFLPGSTFCTYNGSRLNARWIREGRRNNESWLKVNLFSNNFLDWATQILPPHVSIFPHLIIRTATWKYKTGEFIPPRLDQTHFTGVILLMGKVAFPIAMSLGGLAWQPQFKMKLWPSLPEGNVWSSSTRSLMSNSISTPPRKSYICVCVSVFPPRSREQPSCEPCASMLSAASYPTQHHHYILIGQRGRGELHPQSAYNSQNRPESYSLKGIGQTWPLRRAVACRTSFLKGAFFLELSQTWKTPQPFKDWLSFL